MIKNLNYILILITIILLAAVGSAFIFGTSYSWIKSEADGMWRQTILYQEFVRNMNMMVGPLTMALVIVLALCIPKRLFTGMALLRLMGGLLLLTAALSIVLGPRLGISFLLGIAIVLQLIVILMTFVGSKRLVYEVTGFYIQIGSALLHMGLILFLFDMILVGDGAAQRSLHLNIFWVATVFIGLGMVFVFYSRELSNLARRRQAVRS